MVLYKQYDQESLNLQYNNRFHVPAYASYFSTWESLSRQAEKEHTVIKNIAYGSLPEETMDIYPSRQPGSRVLLFFHGGYWQMMDKSGFQFIAPSFIGYNITVAIVNYPLAPFLSMDQLLQSCSKIEPWLHKHLATFSGDINRVYIAGYSAGAHICAMLMEAPALPVYRGLCSLSGLFNLVPIQLSNLNQVIGMDKEMAIRNSPVCLPSTNKSPFVLAVGCNETTELKDQSREMYTHRKAAGNPVELMEIPGLNHFSILEAFIDQKSNLHRAMLGLMGIEAGSEA